jgi:hypothetical protein
MHRYVVAGVLRGWLAEVSHIRTEGDRGMSYLLIALYLLYLLLKIL